MDKTLKEFTAGIVEDCLPGNSIDCVILGYADQELKILLLKWKDENLWCLPGGFIRKDEDMDEAAHRILEMRTGLHTVYLNQFHTFGSEQRSKVNSAMQHQRITQMLKRLHDDDSRFIEWVTQRFITTGYFALVDIKKSDPSPDFLCDKCEWKALSDLPELIIDHNQIIAKCLDHLRIQINYLPIGLSLLPEKFTMKDLQKLYEAVLRKPLDRSNFQRKILKLGFLNRHEKQMRGGAHKAPFLYSFNQGKYDELIAFGIDFF
ncbi:MAG: NUDIX domain-containing protein [Bacteroidota bacterium]